MGYNYPGLFKNGVAQIPSFGGSGWTQPGSGADLQPRRVSKPAALRPGLYADKWMPSFSDTVTKVWGTHTLKAGILL